jgi:hypothetical protein
LARCQLDVRHPKFLKAFAGAQENPALQSGLAELVRKVARDHKLSGWVNHPMAPHSQETVWKWDFAPDGIRGATRKSWRIYAHVPNPRASEPVPATVFLLHPRSETPRGNVAKLIAEALKQFLSANVGVVREEDRFRRSTDDDGKTRSICYECFDTVAVSYDIAEIDLAESLHQCPEPQPD